MKQKKKIFISYRRDTGIDVAARVNTFFTSKGYEVFYDIKSMKLGYFDKQIFAHIKKSDFFILLLSEGALDRCMNEEDWVRKEIECALKHKILIVPLIFPHFVFPKELPEKLKPIPNLNGVNYDAVLFDMVMERMIQLMDPHLLCKCQIVDLLEKLYSVTIKYRNALKTGDQQNYNSASNELVSLLQDLYYFGESTRFENVQLSEKAFSIVKQFNKYIPYFNAFSNMADRQSSKAQEYALCAEREFLSFVELIQKTLQDLR